jgi:hypothetical protein
MSDRMKRFWKGFWIFVVGYYLGSYLGDHRHDAAPISRMNLPEKKEVEISELLPPDFATAKTEGFFLSLLYKDGKETFWIPLVTNRILDQVTLETK